MLTGHNLQVGAAGGTSNKFATVDFLWKDADGIPSVELSQLCQNRAADEVWFDGKHRAMAGQC